MIDSHQHFWIYNETEYDWMDSRMDVLKRDFLPTDLLPLMQKTGVTATVAVQARRTVEETEWLLKLAEKHSFIAGVVGWLDMESPNFEADLERLADNRLLRGIRELIHDMPDPEYAVKQPHTGAVAALGRYSLTYDLLLRPEHLRAAVQLVDMLPGQPFVVDHLAKPDVRNDGISGWSSDLRALAERPNVYCKVSGLVTEADWDNWTYGQLEPYIDTAFSAFGPDRIMFGSDWPVATCATTYQEVVSVAEQFARKLSRAEQKAFFSSNCRRFYGLADERSRNDSTE